MDISEEKQKKIIDIIGNIMEYTQDQTRSSLYAQTQDNYKDVHLKMAEEAGIKIQKNIAELADVLNVSRDKMPGLLPEYWVKEV